MLNLKRYLIVDTPFKHYAKVAMQGETAKDNT